MGPGLRGKTTESESRYSLEQAEPVNVHRLSSLTKARRYSVHSTYQSETLNSDSDCDLLLVQDKLVQHA